MKKLHAFCLLSSAFCLLSSAHAQHYVWSGESSANWSDPGNWTNAPGSHPVDLVALTNTPNLILRIGNGAHLPSNQDIKGLVLNELQINTLTGHITVANEPITFNIIRDHATPGAFEVAFSNDIIVAAAASSWSIRRDIRFYGPVTESKPNTIFLANDGGSAHFYNTVGFTGGFNQNQAHANFYGMHTTGPTFAPGTSKPSFFGRSDSGSFKFQLPPGKAEYEYEFFEDKGAMACFSANVADKVTVILNAPILAHATAANKRFIKSGDGIMELNAATNTFTGHLNVGGLLIVNGELTPSTENATDSLTFGGALDLNGVDYLGRNLRFENQGGPNNDGRFRNQNPWRRSTFDGEMRRISANVTDMIQFGGVGDILYTGDITDTADNKRFAKAGPGTLTMTGESLCPSPVTVHNGTLCLDYGLNNKPKIHKASKLSLAGTLLLLGATNGVPTELEIGVLDAGSGDSTLPNAVRISPLGRNGNTAALKAASFTQMDRSTVNYAPNGNGAVYTAINQNNAVLGTLPVRQVFNGKSFARVATPAVGGWYKIEELPATVYVNDFDTTKTNEFVDVIGHLVLPGTGSAETIAALRFNSDEPSSLTLQKGLKIYGETVRDGYRGAILVTPNVGTNTVFINGSTLMDDGVNGWLTIHQYNETKPLVINSCLTHTSGSGTGVVKSGPGELILNNETNPVGSLTILEGTVTVPSMACLGAGAEILMARATLRYVGTNETGHATSRQIRLRSSVTLDASGVGPWTLSHATQPFVMPNQSKNNLLTLTGTGKGVITGPLDLLGGRLWKKGSGTWVLDGHSSNIVWGAEILEGTLVVNGTLGRDVSVGHDKSLYPQIPQSQNSPTLSGSGSIKRNLTFHDGSAIEINPSAPPLKVGKNLAINGDVALKLPNKFSTVPAVVIQLGPNGKIKGNFKKPDNAYVNYDHANGTVTVAYRPTGTLLMVR